MTWVETTIGDIYTVASSKRVLKSDWKKFGIPFYRGREVTHLSKYGYVENELYITEDMYLEFCKNYGVPSAGDIMITAIGTIGNTYIVKDSDKFYFKDASILWLKKNEAVDTNFINYWFKSDKFFGQLNVGTGATVDTLTIGKMQSLKIKIPSLLIQQDIVKKLDAIFAEIEKAVAATEANIKNAEALFQAYLAKVFQRNDGDYKNTTLGNYYDVRDGTHDSPKFYESGYPLITSKNLKNGEINFEKIQYINKTDYLNISLRSGVRKGDVLMAMIGTIGNPVVIDNDSEFAIKNVALFKINNNQSSHFLRYYLSSDHVIRKMKKEAKGATQKFVGLGYLRSFPISVPPLEKQMNIVKELEQYEIHTKKLLSLYSFKSNNLIRFKQSILNQTFNANFQKTLQ